MRTHLLLLHAISPLHLGIGRGVGAIDLPIARDQATKRPLAPGSGIKGVLRDAHEAGRGEAARRAETFAIFGPSTDRLERDSVASAVHFGDARLILFPSRSMKGTFAWITCPDVLRFLARDAALCGLGSLPQTPDVADSECAVVPLGAGEADASELVVTLGAGASAREMVYLEDLDLAARRENWVSEWASLLGSMLFAEDATWQAQVGRRLCVVSNVVFDFLCRTATDVRARIVLDDNKAVQNLWYEESLPSESVLAGLLHIAPPLGTAMPPVQMLDQLRGLMHTHSGPQLLQFGGKASVGRGLCFLHLIEAPAAADDAGAQVLEAAGGAG